MRGFLRACLPVASLCLLAACGEDTPVAPEIRPVRTLAVEPAPLEDDRQAVGEIKPRLEIDVGFRIAGKLLARTVDVGALVEKGTVLARLDDQDSRNKLKSAEADLRSAEASLEQAVSTEQRQSKLLKSGATTRANYDNAVRELRAAESSVESAKASLALARDQIAYSELRADIDGIVTAVGAEPGQVVNTGQMIVRLAPPVDKDAVFDVAESALRGGKPTEPIVVVVTLLSDPSIGTEGRVREVSPVADPATRTFQVKVELQDPPPQMRFGSAVFGRLKALSAPVVMLPGSAIFEKDGKPAVWIYDAGSRTVKLKPVGVGRFETDRVIIADGLAKGDVVVTAGVHRLREGQEVRLIGEPKP